MSEVSFSLGNRVERIPITKEDTDSSVEQKLVDIFGINASAGIYGIRNSETGQIYSLLEIRSNPMLLHGRPGNIIVGVLSPSSRKRQATLTENLFKYIFNECNNRRTFRFLDYFVLRVLYNKKASSLIPAINLMIENDTEALNRHLHLIVSQVKDSTAIKMGVLRHIAVNMQMNKEISYAHTSVLLNLIQQEDGLVCDAYMQFDKDDNLAELKNALLRILLLTVRPSCIPPEERNEAHRRQSQNRGSWRTPSGTLDISRVLEELGRAELFLYSLFELNILSEGTTMSILQAVGEDPSVLHSFVELIINPTTSLQDPSTYAAFIQSHNVVPHTVHPLRYPFHDEPYPTDPIIAQLLELQKSGIISADEYVGLYRRCAAESPVLRHIFHMWKQTGKQEEFAKSVKLAISVYSLLRPHSESISDPAHAAILQQVYDAGMLGAEELRWVIQEYCQGNEVVRSAFSLCEETQDMCGFVEVLHSMMEMVQRYETAEEAQEFLTVLVRELLEEGSLSQQQAIVLSVLLQEPSQCLCDLYQEYRRSGDFEGLLGALLYVSSSELHSSEDTPEEVEEKEGVSLPSREEVLETVRSLQSTISEEEKSVLIRLIEEGNVDIICSIARYLNGSDSHSVSATSALVQELKRVLRDRSSSSVVLNPVESHQ